MTSSALWLPLLWLAILGSRAVSLWFGVGMRFETPGDYVEGSPLDRNVFLIIICTGFIVLWRRRVDWGLFCRANRGVCLFFIYCGISVIWSDYFFVGVKRWSKDCGNIIMVLIILTEENPVDATRAVFARFCYLVLPLSVVLIKYYSDFGMYYTGGWEKMCCGVAMEKNALGCDALVCALFMVWDFLEMRNRTNSKMEKLDICNRCVLLFIVVWLLDKAKSSTALSLFILGTIILICSRFAFVRIHIRRLGTYSLAAGSVVLVLYSFPEMDQAFVDLMGRDMTLTGRTEIWREVLKEPINPLLGTGYQSFWIGPRAEKYWERWIFHPNQSHNGYIETYLNGGLLGLGLLIVMLVGAGAGLKKTVLLGSSYSTLRFAYFAVMVFYNWTEAMFDKLSPSWFVLLLACLDYWNEQSPIAEIGRGAEGVADHQEPDGIVSSCA